MEELEIQEKEPWEQMNGEPHRWFNLFNEYRLLGVSRSLRKLYRKKRAEKGMEDIPDHYGAPTNWTHYAREWKWKERAEAWDISLQEDQEDEVEAVLGRGIALAHNRIIKLIAIADKLEEYILDPKTTRVSPYVLEQYRGLLDDIAKEKGERVKETRLTGAKGGPVKIVTEWGRGGSASDAWERKGIDAPTTVEGQIIKEITE